MAGRQAIKKKSDITEITRQVAERLGIPQVDVKKEINYYWIDVDLMFSHHCGYGTFVPNFGHFLLYTKGVYGIAKFTESRIIKYMKFLVYYKNNNAPVKYKHTAGKIAEMMTRLILLDYSIDLYKTEILATYPRKYKIGYYTNYRAVLTRLEKLFGIPLAKFPITINYPVQEMFVRSLRTKGVLRNPVVSNIRNRKKKAKPKNLPSDEEV